MRVPRSLVGKEVRITWLDPTGWKGESSFPSDHRDLPRGRAGLAKWVTYGKIEDLTDGVVRITKCMGEDAIFEKEQTHRMEVDFLPEELIQTIAEFSVKEIYGAADNPA